MKVPHQRRVVAQFNVVGRCVAAESRKPELVRLTIDGVLGYDTEPLFTSDMLVYGGRHYLIGESHKEFLQNKVQDEDYYLLTPVGIAKELALAGLTEAHVCIAAGLPLTWTSGQKESFKAYLSRNKKVRLTIAGRTTTFSWMTFASIRRATPPSPAQPAA